MSRRKTVWIVLAVALMALTAAVVLAACGSGSTTGSSSPGATKTLTIGVLMPFSGDGALWGTTELASIQVAADHLNAAGGVKAGNDTYKLAVKAYDNQWDPAVSATVARKAVQDGVRYVVSWSGPEVLAENAATRGTTVLTFVTASDAICQGPKHPNNYNSWFYYPDNLQVLYTYAKKIHPDFQTVVPIVTDDAVSIQEVKYLQQYVTPIGFNVLPAVKISGDETDYYPVLTPLIKKGVDIIDIASPGPEAASLIIKQAHELGYKGIFAHADAPNIDDYAKVAGWKALEGFLGAPVYTELSAVGKTWQTDYMKKTQGDKSTGPDRRLRQHPAAGGSDHEGRHGRPGCRQQGPADGDRRGHHRQDDVRRRRCARHPPSAGAADRRRRSRERQDRERLHRLAARISATMSPSPSPAQ